MATNAVIAAMIPQVTMMRQIHFLALHRSTITDPGTSNKKYPRKKTPAPKPMMLSPKEDMSSCIVSFAIPTLVRST